jgi:hypothetical protein
MSAESVADADHAAASAIKVKKMRVHSLCLLSMIRPLDGQLSDRRHICATFVKITIDKVPLFGYVQGAMGEGDVEGKLQGKVVRRRPKYS